MRIKICISQQAHSHSFYQIIWFKNRAGKHFVDFEEYQIEEDTLFFIAKNQVHFFEQHNDYEGYLMHFNEDFIISNETDINFFLSYRIFNNKEKPYFKIPNSLKDQVSGYFSQIENELRNANSFGNGFILSNLLKAFLLVIEREMRKELDSSELVEQKNHTFLMFRNLLENSFKKNWSVLEYAEQLSISGKTLNSIVKSQTGKTVSQFITDRKILEAKRQLTHTNSYVNQIAFNLGFQDPYYFIKYFKKHVKCTPLEFRKSIS